jgi:hypothetical protein
MDIVIRGRAKTLGIDPESLLLPLHSASEGSQLQVMTEEDVLSIVGCWIGEEEWVL